MKKCVLFITAFVISVNMLANTDLPDKDSYEYSFEIIPFDPVLMTVNGNEITKSEFEYIYNKNNTNNTLDRKDLNEYVQLFVDLKLKVAEAQAQGLDTTSAFKNEFNGYRSQSAKEYLTNDKAEEEAMHNAYNRLTEERNVSHILIRIDRNNPDDTLAAYKKAVEARKRLRKEDFAKVAKAVSEDIGTADKGGNLGFITGFQTILPFENAAYSLKVGEISQPVRSPYGYHIIKLNSVRPSVGSVHVAHIMKTIQPDATEETIAGLKASIDSAYTRLQAGDDFAELAKKVSDHTYTSQNGGDLGWFSTGRSGAGPDFENAAFALNIGEYSKPVRSYYGFHIIKALEKKPLGSYDEKKEEIKRVFRNDGRNQVGVQEFKKALRSEYDLQIIQSSLAEIKKAAKGLTKTDSLFFERTAGLNKPLFSFSTIVINQDQFIDYLKQSPNRPLNIDEYLYTFIDDKLYEYEDTHLEDKHFKFRMLMQEYYDGMLMFEISSKEVWDKTVEDTTGLREFFEQNRQNYTWDIPRFKGTLVYIKDKKTAKKVKKLMKSTPKDSIPVVLKREFNTDSIAFVKTETGLFVKGDNKAVDKFVFGEGEYSSTDYPFVEVAPGSVTLPDGPNDYRDMKGIVISDYQNYLQDKWVKELRKKYPVEIDEDVLKNVELK